MVAWLFSSAKIKVRGWETVGLTVVGGHKQQVDRLVDHRAALDMHKRAVFQSRRVQGDKRLRCELGLTPQVRFDNFRVHFHRRRQTADDDARRERPAG